jgi:hypothetical protein
LGWAHLIISACFSETDCSGLRTQADKSETAAKKNKNKGGAGGTQGKLNIVKENKSIGLSI